MAIWQFVNELKLETILDIKLFKNNKMSITLIKNVKSQHQTKHIDVQYHYIKELINKKEFNIKKICNSKILANKMTKVL